MNNFLKEAIKLQEVYAEKQAISKHKFFFLKVSSESEEAEKLREIELETAYANVVIVRCENDGQKDN
jgi:hypothetical protein